MERQEKQKKVHPEALIPFLWFLKSRLPAGVDPTTGDWNLAYEIFWAQAAIATQQWKITNLSIGEYAPDKPLMEGF